MKKVEIEGYGKLFLNGIEFKSGEGVVVDATGKPLEKFSEGGMRATTGYKDANGGIVASKDLCRKMNIKGEDTIIQKLKATTNIAKGDTIEKLKAECDYDFNNGVERKLYVVSTDSKELRTLLNDNKGLVFPFVAGAGFKAWKGILRKHTTKKGKDVLTLGLTRGNMDNAFDLFADEPIEVEIGTFGDNSNAKKLVDLD